MERRYRNTGGPCVEELARALGRRAWTDEDTMLPIDSTTAPVVARRAIAPEPTADESTLARYEAFKANDIDKDRSALLAGAGTSAAKVEARYRAILDELPTLNKFRAAIIATGAMAGNVDAASAVATYEQVIAREPNIDKFRAALLTNAALASGRDGAALLGSYRAIKAASPDIDFTRAATLATAASKSGTDVDDALRVYEDIKSAVPDIDKNRAAMLASAALLSGNDASAAVGTYRRLQELEPDIDKHRAALLTGHVLLTDAEPRDVVNRYRGFKVRDIDQDRAATLTAAAVPDVDRPDATVFTANAWLQTMSERSRDTATDLASDARFADSSWEAETVANAIDDLAQRPMTSDALSHVERAGSSADRAVSLFRSGRDDHARSELYAAASALESAAAIGRG